MGRYQQRQCRKDKASSCKASITRLPQRMSWRKEQTSKKKEDLTMGDAVLTDGEISKDASDTLKANGDVKEDARTPLTNVTRKEKKE